ncbi:Clathrin_heavy chain [Hexamita inflata]|uniref:Clathrin heavy chain n=1 Tax=Hexamita inflata TaxID=28002 RepID=A0AA86UNC5_9EUKA|nr:Clathrin heavy chain [Hexamita inflata]
MLESKQIVDCKQLNVNESLLRKASLSLTSELGFCIRDHTASPPSLMILNFTNPSLNISLQIKADGVLLKPNDPGVMVLRTDRLLQVSSIQQKKVLQTYKFQEPRKMEIWDWVDNNTLIIMLNSDIYTWDITTNDLVLICSIDLQKLPLLNIKVSSIQLNTQYCIIQTMGVSNQQIDGYSVVFNRSSNMITNYRSLACCIYQSDNFYLSTVQISSDQLQITTLNLQTGFHSSTSFQTEYQIPIYFKQSKSNYILVTNKNVFVFDSLLNKINCVLTNEFAIANSTINGDLVTCSKTGEISVHILKKIEKDTYQKLLNEQKYEECVNIVLSCHNQKLRGETQKLLQLCDKDLQKRFIKEAEENGLQNEAENEIYFKLVAEKEFNAEHTRELLDKNKFHVKGLGKLLLNAHMNIEAEQQYTKEQDAKGAEIVHKINNNNTEDILNTIEYIVQHDIDQFVLKKLINNSILEKDLSTEHLKEITSKLSNVKLITLISLEIYNTNNDFNIIENVFLLNENEKVLESLYEKYFKDKEPSEAIYNKLKTHPMILLKHVQTFDALLDIIEQLNVNQFETYLNNTQISILKEQMQQIIEKKNEFQEIGTNWIKCNEIIDQLQILCKGCFKEYILKKMNEI